MEKQRYLNSKSQLHLQNPDMLTIFCGFATLDWF